MRFSAFSIFKTVVIVVVLAALGVGGYIAYSRIPSVVKELVRPPARESISPGEDVIVQVPKGASLAQVAAELEKRGVISNRLVFRLVAMIRGEQRTIKAGEYGLKTGSDAGEVLDTLISGRTLMFSFTVPEGYDLWQVAEVLHQKGIAGRDDFLALTRNKEFIKEVGVQGESLEGYLFPDTYFLPASEKTNTRQLVRRMVKRFHDVYDKYVRETAEQHGWSTAQVVTLASLIEKEARATEHALVSAVFHNRLRQGMKLDSDPTVIYGIKPMGSKITRADLDRKHPYNTYQVKGLPPGPIANPGKESLIAAVKPADEDYLYFVAKNDGTHQFSKSLQEHNQWVNLYQRRNQGHN